METPPDLNEAHTQQLRDIATNLLKSGMAFPDVIAEIYRLSKILAPQGIFILTHAEVATLYTGAATEGLGDAKPAARPKLERK